VPGGINNVADGRYSLAAGRRAKAVADGSFAWADSTASDFQVLDDNAFGVRASGGVFLYTDPGLASGAYLAPGSGTWATLSDRSAKENFVPVDGEDVMAARAEELQGEVNDLQTRVAELEALVADLTSHADRRISQSLR
jgi:hypothetical protein